MSGKWINDVEHHTTQVLEKNHEDSFFIIGINNYVLKTQHLIDFTETR